MGSAVVLTAQCAVAAEGVPTCIAPSPIIQPAFVPVQYMVTPTELVPTGLPVVPEPARSEQPPSLPVFSTPFAACWEAAVGMQGAKCHTTSHPCGPLCVAASLRLVNPNKANTTAGRLEVLHNGKWGTICSDTFSDVEATIVCRQVSSGEVAPWRCGDVWSPVCLWAGSCPDHLPSCCRRSGWATPAPQCPTHSLGRALPPALCGWTSWAAGATNRGWRCARTVDGAYPTAATRKMWAWCAAPSRKVRCRSTCVLPLARGAGRVQRHSSTCQLLMRDGV